MALPGYYLINFTDPRKSSFIIEPYQTDGGITPTSPIPHGSARRISSSLLLYGRDVPNYGERIAENFVHLLENFAGPMNPNAPIEGQLWFDTGSSYTIAAWTNGSTLALSGDVQADFAQYIADETVLAIAFRPVNSALDNSLQRVNVIAKTVSIAGGNTIVSFESEANEPIVLPATVVGGFVAADTDHYARMRVATTVGSEIKWVDVTNVYSSEDSPEVRHRMVGDLWLDTATDQLMVYGTAGWASVAAKYLPTAGGSLTGDLLMGGNRVYSTAVTTAAPEHQYALVNREYVDGVQADLQGQLDDLGTQLDDVAAGGLDGKVSKTGDEMTGSLVFGDGSSTSTVARGIDLNNNPIVRLSITWNPADYLSASFQPTHAVTKYYVAQAFQQHLLDESHGAGGFIQVQGDGTGLIPNTIVFNAGTAGTSYALKWADISGNNEHSIYANFSGATSQLVIEAGTDSADSVDIRHGLAVDPLFRFQETYSRSFNSLYIHDGQPQPVSNDVPLALVDDNKAATKGFVRQYVEDNIPTDTGGTGTTVTSIDYTYNLAALTYTLTVFQDNGVGPIGVDVYHQHDPYDTPYLYSPADEPWLDFDTDLLTDYVVANSPNYPVTDMGTVVTGLLTYKAPVQDAIFNNLPRVGVDAEIIEYNSAAKTVRILGDFTTTILSGMTILLDATTGNDGLYTVSAVAAGALSGGEPTTVLTVLETLATDGVESADAFLNVGAHALKDEPRALITRTTLDYELDRAEIVKYTYWKAPSGGTNVVHALGFTYTPGRNKLWVFKNGMKQRIGIISGGDFNETSTSSITIATVAVDDEFEIYEI